MAENQESLQLLLPLHGLKGQQSPQRFAGTGSGEDQQIVVGTRITIQAPAQQLNQLLLPLARSNHRRWWLIPDVEAEGRDDGCRKDESF